MPLTLRPNKVICGCLLLGGIGFVIGAMPSGTVRAANLTTNEALCSTNAIPAAQRATPLPEGTLRMIERLRNIRNAANPDSNEFMNVELVKLLETRCSQSTNAHQKASLGFRLAEELLDSGQPEACLRQIQDSEHILTSFGVRLNSAGASNLRMLTATAMLRIGEQENCLDMHNAESCLFPLSPAAFHKRQRGSRGAIVLLTRQLRQYPQDLSARWLINLAYMTLGEYPDKVPAEWLIPPKTFQSDFDLPHFTDVAGPLGINVNGLAGGCILDDFDNDGFIDIVTSSWGYDGVFHYFHNDGDGHFSDRTEAAGLAGLMGGLNI